MEEVEALEAATEELWAMCLQAVVPHGHHR